MIGLMNHHFYRCVLHIHTHTRTHACKTNEGEMNNIVTAGLVLQDAKHHDYFFT